MRLFRSGLAAIAAATLGLGCDTQPKPVDKPMDLNTPHFESMKADMIKNMQKTANGRRMVKDVSAPGK